MGRKAGTENPIVDPLHTLLPYTGFNCKLWLVLNFHCLFRVILAESSFTDM